LYTARRRIDDHHAGQVNAHKVLQAAGRVIRTPRDKGVVLLIDNRFAMPDYRRLMPPHWSHLKMIYDTEELERELWRFWEE